MYKLNVYVKIKRLLNANSHNKRGNKRIIVEISTDLSASACHMKLVSKLRLTGKFPLLGVV